VSSVHSLGPFVSEATAQSAITPVSFELVAIIARMVWLAKLVVRAPVGAAMATARTRSRWSPQARTAALGTSPPRAGGPRAARQPRAAPLRRPQPRAATAARAPYRRRRRGTAGAGGRLGTARLVGLVRSATTTTRSRRRGATGRGRPTWHSRSSSMAGRAREVP